MSRRAFRLESPTLTGEFEPRFESVGLGIIPRHVVPVIAQDRAGFLWIATGDGLMRFDGCRFRPQERESPDPATRNLGWIRSMLAGRDGRLWIGSEFDGLAVYDPFSEKVGSCGGDSREHGCVLPTIRALAEDATGSIWVGSEGGGVERFDAQCRRTPATAMASNRAACRTVACRRCWSTGRACSGWGLGLA